MSSDEDSDDYGRPKRAAARRGRKAKRNALNELGASTSSYGGPSKVKLKVKAGGSNTIGKRSAKGGFTIGIGTGADANVPPQWQGFADRELDSDTEEPLVFEEAFMLRMPIPQTEEQVVELQQFAEMVKKREPMDEKSVWFKFLDSRRAVFNLNKTLYNAKLVDLPCLIESQKTQDDKHIFKTADISQMLLVEHPIASEQAAIATDKPFKIEDYIYPHGITPPLRNVRKRRFKPRINKQAIEIAERQVERLVQQDEDADEVKYELVDESEIQEGEQAMTQQQYEAELAGVNMALDPALLADAASRNVVQEPEQPVAGPSTQPNTAQPIAGPSSASPKDKDLGDVDGEGEEDADGTDGEGEDDEDEDGEEDEDEDSDAEGYDSDLAAMIEGEIGGGSKGTGAGAAGQNANGGPGANASATGQKKAAEDQSDASGGSDEDGDSDDLFGKGRSDDDEEEEPLGDATVKDNEETLEAKRRIRLMADEMKDLENAVNRKKQEVSRAPNPIIKRRFEDALKKLSQEFEMKKAQHLAAQNRLQHFQNEIKKADAAELEAAAGPPANADADANGKVNGQYKSDPATVFGTSSEKQKGKEKDSLSAPSRAREREREQSEDMQIDTRTPEPPATIQIPHQDDISVGKTPAQRDEDDIQVSVNDFAVPQENTDVAVDVDMSDLFGDADDD